MKPRILFIDDEAALVDVFRTTMAVSGGHQIFAASNHQEALEILRTNPVDVILYVREPLSPDVCEFAWAVKSDPRTKQTAIVIYSQMPETEAVAMFAEARMDFRKFVAACCTPQNFREVFKSFFPEPPISQEAPSQERPGTSRPVPRRIYVDLLLSSDDPEWPSFLSQRCDLGASPLSKIPPSPERMKKAWPRIKSTVLVDPDQFVEAVRAYEAIFKRKALVKKGSAVIGLEEISNNCTVSFTMPDAPQSSGS